MGPTTSAGAQSALILIAVVTVVMPVVVYLAQTTEGASAMAYMLNRHRGAAAGLGVASLLGVLSQLVGRQIFSHEMLQGSARWTWLVGGWYQSFLFPYLALSAWSAWSYDLSDFLLGTWPEFQSGDADGATTTTNPTSSRSPMVYETLFMYCFFGFLAKDFIVKMNPIYFVHHAVCALAIMLWLFWPAPLPIGAAVAGCTIFELGSLSQTVFYLRGIEAWAEYFHFFLMSASNIAGVLCHGVVLWFFLPTTPILMRVLASAISVGLASSRQLYCHENCKRLLESWSTAKNKGSSPSATTDTCTSTTGDITSIKDT